ncbi:hypothetical protein EJB05_31625 [Eragrostis curvula]|uniref:Ubiquitin fusion degradation protein n=1 Tax=Eragrostis curvula TaxID=38414 RepID=A0A5J9UEV5_9POAL|nr:hypothetical protein EJB05_31625 [Eragrostis curvula]
MDFDEYLKLQRTSFVQYYRCLPTSYLGRGDIVEDGNKVFLPTSAVDRVCSLNLEWPLHFRIQNPSTGRASHCGMLEFVAEEGFIHVPTWFDLSSWLTDLASPFQLMERLGLEVNDLVLLQQKALPAATFLKLQAHTKDFLDVAYPRELLEHNLKKYACLTAGETITVTEGDRRYCLNVLELQPEDAVSVLETDVNTDFAPPLDYVEPPPPPVMPAGQAGGEPAKFTGVAARMDGKPVELPTTPAPPAAAGVKPKRGLRFGGASAAAGGGVSKGKEDKGAGKEQEQRFTGTAYSLQ